MTVFGKYICQLGLLATLFMVGCGGGGDGFDGPTGTVSGKLTFQGKPLPEGSAVLFKHEETGQVASGTLSTTDGSFRLRWRGSYDILAGAYKVAVSTGTGSGAITVPGDPNAMESSTDYKEMMDGGGAEETKPKDTGPAIPAKYLSTATTDEMFDVKPGDNTYEFDIP